MHPCGTHTSFSKKFGEKIGYSEGTIRHVENKQKQIHDRMAKAILTLIRNS